MRQDATTEPEDMPDAASESREARIARLAEPALEQMGYRLVRVLFAGKSRPTLQIMAERIDEQPMTVDDCAEISRHLSALFDVEEPVRGAYVLEVSSPGIDRPLVKPADFTRWTGFAARLETHRPIDGRRRFTGLLLGFRDDKVQIRLDEGEAEVPFADIQKAKLLLTDELIAAVAGRN